jgi:uncharacterized protein YqeY
MNLEEKVMAEMKDAMKSKNEAALRGLRAIKAEIIKAKTEPGAGGAVSAEGEAKLLQKMVKQRRDALEIYTQQNRADLDIIAELDAKSPADLGKVMGAASKKLAGRADGKAISLAVKALLVK